MRISACNRALPNRQSIRLQSHNYSSPGAYFITICTWKRRRIFSKIVDSRVLLSPLGRAVERSWFAIPKYFEGAAIDEFVIMPDHVHGIVHLPADGRSVPLSGVVRRFKLSVTQWSRKHLDVQRVWHRNYYERIVRDQRALDAIRRYIAQNPAAWR